MASRAREFQPQSHMVAAAHTKRVQLVMQHQLP